MDNGLPHVGVEHVDESAEGQSVVPAGGEVGHRDLEHGKPFSH
jgi:hypothetical protein